MDLSKDYFSIIDPDINHFTSEPNFETHSTASFSNKQNLDPNALNLIHHNARSLMKPGRIDEYEIFLSTLKASFDILVFTETWTNNNNIDQCEFEGYRSAHLIRDSEVHQNCKNNGGGVSIFVKNILEFKLRDDLTIMLPFMECIFIETKFMHQKYLIGGIYRVPDTSTTHFIDRLNNLIEPINSAYKIILLGDYNIDFLKDDIHKNNFQICLQSNYLIPTILSPTRVATKMQNGQQITTETLIDNIFTNHLNYHSGVIESSITDHYSIYISISGVTKPCMETNSIEYRIINDAKTRTFHSYLHHMGISEIYEDDNAKSATGQFFNIMQHSYEKSFPIKEKTITDKKNKKPWVSDELLKDMEARDKLNRAVNKNKVERKIFTDFRNELENRLREAKTTYFRKKFEEHSKNIKKTWEIINSVIRSRKS